MAHSQSSSSLSSPPPPQQQQQQLSPQNQFSLHNLPLYGAHARQ